MRAIANLTLSFGLVSIPVKLYSATESSAAIRMTLMAPSGRRVRQQYVAEPAQETPEAAEREAAIEPAAPPSARARATSRSPVVDEAVSPPRPSGGVLSSLPRQRDIFEAKEPEPEVVDRQAMVKGYEFERGRFVVFTPEELKALQAASRDSVDIVAFIPAGAVDPVYYNKAYLLAPAKRGEKTYSLLLAALQRTHRCALAKWSWKGKEVVVEIRPASGGLVLQQLFYADEVRLPADMHNEIVDVSAGELELAVRLIEHGTQDRYDPRQFADEEKRRLLEAVERKIAGEEIVSAEVTTKPQSGGQVIDLLEALRASLPHAGIAPERASAGAPIGSDAAAIVRKPSRKGATTSAAPRLKRGA